MKAWMVVSMTCAAAACGGSQGTSAHDMSAAQHEASAAQEQAAADAHSRQYNPAAKSLGPACGGATPDETSSVCWSSIVNPTEQHRKDAQQHRELAEQHRAAAKTLRDAEAQACAGIPDRDRDTSPFFHREDITSVSEVEGGLPRGQLPRAVQLAGAKAVFRAVPGLTTEWLQRLVDCHIARAAAVGHNIPEMDYCPLAVKGAQAFVSSTGDGFAIVVTAEDPVAVREIQSRVRLAGTSGAP